MPIGPIAADCKSVGVRLPRFESLTRRAAETVLGLRRCGRGPAFTVSGVVLLCPAVHGQSRSNGPQRPAPVSGGRDDEPRLTESTGWASRTPELGVAEQQLPLPI